MPPADSYDVLVVGAGHAGVEAALASARMGMRTALLTLSEAGIAQMSCNPAVGGLAKGHLVRELDALGGEMALAIDRTGIQFKMLNRSKGRAVWSPRAQADKHKYSAYFRSLLSRVPGLHVLEGHADALILEKNRVLGVQLQGRGMLRASRTILCNGTFFRGLIHIGNVQISSGRYSELPSYGISDQLKAAGMQVGRLKTGTPPRVHRDSVDFSKMIPQAGDKDPEPFSFRTTQFQPPDVSCFLTHTNPESHEILASSLDRSPLYSGQITGTGPRYCPSIEDKIVRFSEKLSHQLFLEPEWEGSDQWYVNGFSSSLPLDVQLKAIRRVPGLEKVQFIRPAYAIEYDYFPSWQIHPTLETRSIQNLFFAGQINGTSGYEEAAVQGFIAGVNAVKSLLGQAPLLLSRREAYSGVLIDDLIGKESSEPYRMFTSLAEHRLLLRYDNAHHRLHRHARQIGILSESQLDAFAESEENSASLHRHFKTSASDKPFSPEGKSISIDQAIKQKLIHDANLEESLYSRFPEQPKEDLLQAYILSQYDGYIRRQQDLIEKTASLEHRRIPDSMNYEGIPSLSSEGREKLSKLKPPTLGAASRIRGVSPADLQILLIYLKQVPRET